jgi:hypothetical protein
MTKPAKRQHFIARFYLRNFAEPMFSDNLCVYDIRKRRWERRSPDGVGWFRHLCSMIDAEGNRRDDFDQFLKLNVEDPAAPALKKLATGETIDGSERSAVALFVALTVARSPELMNSALAGYLDKLSTGDRQELDALVKPWGDRTGKSYGAKSHSEYLKPSILGGILAFSQNLQDRLLQWEWRLVRTTRDRPFVTSDWPVFMWRDRERDAGFVTFPVSSEVALIVIAGGQFNEARDRAKEVYEMNRRTMGRASEFVVACRECFPADDLLTRHADPGSVWLAPDTTTER